MTAPEAIPQSRRGSLSRRKRTNWVQTSIGGVAPKAEDSVILTSVVFSTVPVVTAH